jgi:hypothetical protein
MTVFLTSTNRYYDVLKNILVVERFSSPSFQGIMQDIYAGELLANLLALALYDAREELGSLQSGDPRAHIPIHYQYHLKPLVFFASALSKCLCFNATRKSRAL